MHIKPIANTRNTNCTTTRHDHTDGYLHSVLGSSGRVERADLQAAEPAKHLKTST